MTISTVTGDTLSPMLVAGSPNGVGVNVDADWTCRVQLLNQSRERIGSEREVTETGVNSDGVTAFLVQMRIEEADLMVNNESRQRPVAYYWSIEVENTALEYRRTTEIQLAVTKKP